jgi:hypothetical protein
MFWNKALRSVALFSLLLCVTIGATKHAVQPTQQISLPLDRQEASQVIGGVDWGCGMLVGGLIVAGNIVLTSATAGMGTAVGISVSLHLFAIACMT